MVAHALFFGQPLAIGEWDFRIFLMQFQQYFTLSHTFHVDPGGMVEIQVDPGKMIGI